MPPLADVGGYLPALMALAVGAFCAASALDVDDGFSAESSDGASLLADIVAADGGHLKAVRLTRLADVNCSGSGGGGFVGARLRWPGWVRDYGSCSSEMRRVEEDAGALLGNLSAPTAADASAAHPRAAAPEAVRKLFGSRSVLEMALWTPTVSGVLGRCTDGSDLCWRDDGARSSEIAVFYEKFGNGSASWTQPLYSCSWRQWTSVLGRASDGGPRLTILVHTSLQTCEINQCLPKGTALLSGTDKCDKSFTRCQHVPGGGFVTGSYMCICKACSVCPPVNGSSAEQMHAKQLAAAGSAKESSLFLETCSAAVSNDGSKEQGAEMLERALLVTSGACIALCWMLMVVITARRDSKAIVAAKWIILEMVLMGATLIYGSDVVQYFPAATWKCLLQPWLRELGFSCTYGALNIKTYKVLAEFRTRKARRVHVRDKDLIKYWLLVVGIAAFYMAAWTAINISYIADLGINVTTTSTAYDDKLFTVCVSTGWDVVTEFVELVFIVSGLYMSFRIRRAPSLFWESRFIAAVLVIECLVSGGYYVARHCSLLNVDPTWAYTLSFCRTQMTITLLLLLMLGPKLWYAFHPPGKGSKWSSEGPHADPMGYGMHVNGQRGNGGDSEFVDVSLKEMEPDEIWRELRRVYTQLQLLKVKVMRYENPHIHEKKHHRIRKQIYCRISRSGHHKTRADSSSAAAGAAGDDDFAGSHEQELLAYESGQGTGVTAAP